MAFAFDTLAYSKRLRAAGIDQHHAEAYAEAAREFIMAELVTKQALNDALDRQRLGLLVQLGGLMLACTGALAALIKLT